MGERFALRCREEVFVFLLFLLWHFVLEVCSGVLRCAPFCAGGVLGCARVLDFVPEVCWSVLEVCSGVLRVCLTCGELAKNHCSSSR